MVTLAMVSIAFWPWVVILRMPLGKNERQKKQPRNNNRKQAAYPSVLFSTYLSFSNACRACSCVNDESMVKVKWKY